MSAAAELTRVQFALAVLDEAGRLAGFVGIGRESPTAPHVATAWKFATVAEAFIAAANVALHHVPQLRRLEVVRVVEPLDNPSLVRYERLDLDPIAGAEDRPV